jgi:hypothetical protein
MAGLGGFRIFTATAANGEDAPISDRSGARGLTSQIDP